MLTYLKIKKITLATKKLVSGIFSGSYRSAFKGPGLEFDEVREYVVGDDIRYIDWNVTSKLGATYLKKFKEERELNFYFLIDVSASGFLSLNKDKTRRDTSVQILSLLANVATINNDKVGAIFFSDIIEKWLPAARGRNQVVRIVNDMIKIKPVSKGTNLGLAISTLYKNMKHKGVCIIISDFRYDSGWRELALLAKKHDVICIRVGDVSDKKMFLKGLFEFKDIETGSKTKIFYNRFLKIEERYKKYWQDQIVFWEDFFLRKKIRYLNINTDEDALSKLVNYFNEKGKR